MKYFFCATALLLCCLGCTPRQSEIEKWKAGSANDDVFLEMNEQEMGALKANDLDYLEVDWLYTPNHNREELEVWASGVKERAEKADITIWSVHLPFGGIYDISQPDETKRQQAVAQNAADIEMICRILAPQKLIIHASAEPIADSLRQAHFDASRKSLAEIAPKAKAGKAKLLVENLPRTCLGNTSTELLQIIDGISNTAICFDVNHLLKEDHATFIQNTAGKIESTHMSDYDKVDERHWIPKQGIIMWPELLHQLAVSGYPGPFIYEVGAGKKKQKVQITDLGFTWRILKDEYKKAYPDKK